MYPDLSYILHDLFGTAPDNWTSIVKTFGVFLALAFLTAAFFLYLELKRKADEGILTTHTIKDEKGNLKEVYPHERVADMTMVAMISGMLGAKIFAILESAENVKAFIDDPIHTFFSGSGVAMYGGLIGGFIGVYWFVTKKLKMNALHMMDAVAIGLILAYAVGRIGCQLSGDGDWGIVAAAKPDWWFLPDWMWAYDFPRNVMNSSGHGREVIQGFVGQYNTRLVPPVYPTPFYETIMATLIGIFLWVIRKRIKVHGVLFMIYLILNGVERFFIEKIRVNDKLHAFGKDFTQAELIAVLLVIIGIVGTIVLVKRAKNTEGVK
jgi:phosphatidylglycerol---prolipoprotein diacylglyceryl transferase